MNIVLDNLLIDLLGVAIRAQRLLDGSILGDGEVLGSRLTIDSTAAGEDDTLDVVLRHQL